jgi:hypothetical protein
MSLTIDRVSWHPQAAEALAGHLAHEATERGAHILLDAAQRRVPYATGNLASSAEMAAGEGADVAVGWSADYARYLHAHPEWQFQGGRSGRWVEEAEHEAAAEIGAVMAESFRAGWPG